MTPAALQGLRVLDVSGTVAAAYCGKLFADHGAEVVNVEPPGGHPIRALPPFKGAPGVESSGLAAYLSVNKRSVVLDLAAEPDRMSFERLSAAADVLIADRDLTDGGLDALAARHPGLVCTSVSWFGRSGPYARYRGSDGVVHSLTGLVRGIGSPEGPPILPSGYQAQIIGGLTAYVATLGLLIGRRLGHPSAGVLDVSILEANLCFTETGAVAAFQAPAGPALPRLGINRLRPTFPMGIYPCRDGWIGITALTPSQWLSLTELTDLPELGGEPRYYSTLERLADADHIEALMKPRFLERTAAEWFHRGQALRIPLALVPTMAELIGIDQFAERGAFVAVSHADIGTFVAPNTPFRLFATPPLASGRAPRLGAHQHEVMAAWSMEASP